MPGAVNVKPTESFPPVALEAEQALLGAILVNNKAFDAVAGFLEEDHFSEPLHQLIYRLCARAIGMGRVAAPHTLASALPKDLQVGDMSGVRYMAHLAAEATTIANAYDYGRRIFETALERELQFAAARVIGNVGHGFGGPTIEEQLEAAEEGLANIRRQIDVNDHSSMSAREAAEAIVEEMKLRRDPEFKRGLAKTGLNDLDAVWGGGLWARRLSVVAARPGMGKTVLMIAIARRVARQGWGVLIFTLEVDANEVTARLIACEMSNTSFPIDYRDVLTGDLDNVKEQSIIDGRDRISEYPIQIDHSAGVGMAEIEARARMVKDRMERSGIQLKLICVDYLGLVKPAERYRGRRVDELGEIAWGAKQMAKRLDVHVMLLSQLSRGLEGRDDKRPVISDLRDSGNIEEHADIVALMYREEYYLNRQKNVSQDESARAANRLEVITGKNRLGPTRTTTLWCNVAENAVDGMSRFQT